LPQHYLGDPPELTFCTRTHTYASEPSSTFEFLLLAPLLPADFATLIGKPVDFFTFPSGGYVVDFMAAGLVVACCLILIFTTAGGSWWV
jgi:hypothetical protein